MKTEKISGRDVELTIAEIYASCQALSNIMHMEFDEQSAYRVGRLKNKLEAIHKDAEKDRFDMCALYGEKDEKGNITIPQPGPAPIRLQDETDDAFNKRVAEHTNLVRDNEGFQKDIAELLQNKCTLNVPPINLPAGFTITPADRMALAWLLGDEDND